MVRHKAVLALITLTCASIGLCSDPSNEEHERDHAEVAVRVNYASLDAGAVVQGKNPEMQGASKLLVRDVDRYALSPCSVRNWVVIGLSDEIRVDEIIIAQHERYSSPVKDLQFYGSMVYPAGASDWQLLGEFQAENRPGEQEFRMQHAGFARFVKVRMKSHYGSEFYCTLTSVRVYGSSVMDSLSEELQGEAEQARAREEGKLGMGESAHEQQQEGLRSQSPLAAAAAAAPPQEQQQQEQQQQHGGEEEGAGRGLDTVAMEHGQDATLLSQPTHPEGAAAAAGTDPDAAPASFQAGSDAATAETAHSNSKGPDGVIPAHLSAAGQETLTEGGARHMEAGGRRENGEGAIPAGNPATADPAPAPSVSTSNGRIGGDEAGPSGDHHHPPPLPPVNPSPASRTDDSPDGTAEQGTLSPGAVDSAAASQHGESQPLPASLAHGSPVLNSRADHSAAPVSDASAAGGDGPAVPNSASATAAAESSGGFAPLQPNASDAIDPPLSGADVADTINGRPPTPGSAATALPLPREGAATVAASGDSQPTEIPAEAPPSQTVAQRAVGSDSRSAAVGSTSGDGGAEVSGFRVSPGAASLAPPHPSSSTADSIVIKVGQGRVQGSVLGNATPTTATTSASRRTAPVSESSASATGTDAIGDAGNRAVDAAAPAAAAAAAEEGSAVPNLVPQQTDTNCAGIATTATSAAAAADCSSGEEGCTSRGCTQQPRPIEVTTPAPSSAGSEGVAGAEGQGSDPLPSPASPTHAALVPPGQTVARGGSPVPSHTSLVPGSGGGGGDGGAAASEGTGVGHGENGPPAAPHSVAASAGGGGSHGSCSGDKSGSDADGSVADGGSGGGGGGGGSSGSRSDSGGGKVRPQLVLSNLAPRAKGLAAGGTRTQVFTAHEIAEAQAASKGTAPPASPSVALTDGTQPQPAAASEVGSPVGARFGGVVDGQSQATGAVGAAAAAAGSGEAKGEAAERTGAVNVSAQGSIAGGTVELPTATATAAVAAPGPLPGTERPPLPTAGTPGTAVQPPSATPHRPTPSPPAEASPSPPTAPSLSEAAAGSGDSEATVESNTLAPAPVVATAQPNPPPNPPPNTTVEAAATPTLVATPESPAPPTAPGIGRQSNGNYSGGSTRNATTSVLPSQQPGNNTDSGAENRPSASNGSVATRGGKATGKATAVTATPPGNSLPSAAVAAAAANNKSINGSGSSNGGGSSSRSDNANGIGSGSHGGSGSNSGNNNGNNNSDPKYNRSGNGSDTGGNRGGDSSGNSSGNSSGGSAESGNRSGNDNHGGGGDSHSGGSDKSPSGHGVSAHVAASSPSPLPPTPSATSPPSTAVEQPSAMAAATDACRNDGSNGDACDNNDSSSGDAAAAVGNGEATTELASPPIPSCPPLPSVVSLPPLDLPTMPPAARVPAATAARGKGSAAVIMALKDKIVTTQADLIALRRYLSTTGDTLGEAVQALQSNLLSVSLAASELHAYSTAVDEARRAQAARTSRRLQHATAERERAQAQLLLLRGDMHALRRTVFALAAALAALACCLALLCVCTPRSHAYDDDGIDGGGGGGDYRGTPASSSFGRGRTPLSAMISDRLLRRRSSGGGGRFHPHRGRGTAFTPGSSRSPTASPSPSRSPSLSPPAPPPGARRRRGRTADCSHAGHGGSAAVAAGYGGVASRSSSPVVPIRGHSENRRRRGRGRERGRDNGCDVGGGGHDDHSPSHHQRTQVAHAGEVHRRLHSYLNSADPADDVALASAASAGGGT